jgi:ABC-type sugar transport system substrate-binding protein
VAHSHPADPIFAALAASCLAIAIAGCGEESRPGPTGDSPGAAPASTRAVIAMLPKLVNIDYFNACKLGAEAAARDIGVDLIFDGPSEATAEGQNQFIETWIRQRVAAICVAPNQPKAVRRFVEQAQRAGIRVLTWDTDAPESGRDLMVSQVDDKVLGEALMDELASQMGEQGNWAIAIGSLDATNLNTWRRHAEARASRYPKMKLIATEVTKENEHFASQRVETLLNAHPDLAGILAFDSNSVPGAADAIQRAGKAGKVALVGNSTPSKMRKYVKDGVVRAFFLWDPRLLGSLTVRLAQSLVAGKALRPGDEVPGYGKLVFSPTDPRVVIVGNPIRFTAENVDSYDFGI